MNVICISQNPEHYNSLSKELLNCASVMFCDSISKAASYLQEQSINSILVVQAKKDFSYEFIDENQRKYKSIIIIDESNINDVFSKLNSWINTSIVTFPWEEGIVRDLIERGNIQPNIDLDSIHDELIKVKRDAENKQQELEQITQMLEENLKVLKISQEELIPLLSSLINLRINQKINDDTKPAKLACNIGELLNVDKEGIVDILNTGFLHNIGLVGLPDSIIHKPYNELSSEDKQRYDKSVHNGHALLTSIPLFEHVAEATKSLYECYDGTGFPSGLKGEDIPLIARILIPSIDYYDLQRNSYFSIEMNSESALKYIQDNKGKKYDPKIVKLFPEALKMISDDSIRQIESVKLDEAKPGMVLSGSIKVKDEVLLLREDKVLTEHLIEKLQNYQNEINQEITIEIYKKK